METEIDQHRTQTAIKETFERPKPKGEIYGQSERQIRKTK